MRRKYQIRYSVDAPRGYWFQRRRLVTDTEMDKSRGVFSKSSRRLQTKRQAWRVVLAHYPLIRHYWRHTWKRGKRHDDLMEIYERRR